MFTTDGTFGARTILLNQTSMVHQCTNSSQSWPSNSCLFSLEKAPWRVWQDAEMPSVPLDSIAFHWIPLDGRWH